MVEGGRATMDMRNGDLLKKDGSFLLKNEKSGSFGRKSRF